MLQVKFISKALFATAGVWLLAGLAQAAEDLLTQAKALMDQRRPQEAYALLVPHQSQRAGNPDYDYLLGIAALDSGRPGEAVFALERVLAVKPDHLQARAEIARAYFMLNESDAAKQEFEAVKGQNPPPEVVATIQKYLSAIDQRVDATRTKIGGYLEVGYGYDSNANSATSQKLIAVPSSIEGETILDDSDLQQKDRFISAAAGANLSHPLSSNLGLFSGVNVKQRGNREHDQFDTSGLDGHLGLRYVRGQEHYSFAWQGHQLDLDHQKYRKTNGANAQWQHTFDGRNMGTLYAQYTQLRYYEQQSRDARQILGGGAFAHVFRNVGAPVGFVGLYLGDEKPKEEEKYPDLGYQFYGLRFGGQYSLRNDLNIVTAFSIQLSKYDAEYFILLTTRRDARYDASLALEYAMMKDWLIKPEVAYGRNDSNIVVFDFRRTEVFLTVRYNFN